MGRDVWLLGAGFSRAASAQMPTMPELSEHVYTVVSHAWEQSWGADLRDDVELLLTYLATQHPWQDEATSHYDLGRFYEIRDALVDVLWRREREATAETTPPPWLTQLIGLWHEHRATIISFNYDTIVERAFNLFLEETGHAGGDHGAAYAVPVTNPRLRTAGTLGGSYIETFELLKLHGSLTWWYSGPEAPPGDIVYDSLMGTAWGAAPQGEDVERLLRDKEPLVVPPLLQKSAFYGNSLLRAQWRRAREAMAEADRLVCIGYSLPATDLASRLLLSTASAEMEVVIVDRNPELVDHYRRLLPDYDVHKGIVGENAVADYIAQLPCI